MQVRVAEHDVRTTRRVRPLSSPWAIAALGLLLAVPVGVLLLSDGPFRVALPVLLVVALAFVAGESFSLEFEFRRQSFSCSISELAFVVALVEVGGFWAAVARAAVVGAVLLAKGFPHPKIVFNMAAAVVEVSVAVALLRWLPVGDIGSPETWASYLVAVLVASMVGALLIAVAVTLSQGYPGRALWASLFLPVAVIGPVAVLAGLSILLLVHATAWSWLLITPLAVALVLVYRRFAAVTREGQSLERVYGFARRVEQVAADEAGTMQIVESLRELLNAERVALWLPAYLDEPPGSWSPPRAVTPGTTARGTPTTRSAAPPRSPTVRSWCPPARPTRSRRRRWPAAGSPSCSPLR